MKKSFIALIFIVFLLLPLITVNADTPEFTFHFLNTYVKIGLVEGVVFTIFLILFIILAQNQIKLIKSKKSMENYNALWKTFADAESNMTYMKDENFKYVFVNHAVEKFYQKSAKDILGLDDFELTNDEFAIKRRQTDLMVIDKKGLITAEEEWNGRTYKATKFPVRMLNGKFGIGAYKVDITEERENTKKREKMLYRHKILAEVLTFSFQSKQEQLDFVLNEALKLTESQYGYIYFYNEDKNEFTLNSWTTGVMEACKVIDKQTSHKLEYTGIWGEAVRQRKPIIVNDFDSPNPLKKGYPQGHVALKKFMTVPVMIDEKIVAVIGLANKINDYDDNDVYEMSLLMSSVWNAIERREAQEILKFERNKYLQILISIGDGVMVVDENRNVSMLNHVAEKLTGWVSEQAQGKNYKNIFALSHEHEGEGYSIKDPIEGAFETDSVMGLENHAVLTSKDGKRYYIEDSAAPIKDEQDTTVGVVLVFRDVTDKKDQQQKIEYLSFHDSLTGLYNRRFFEEELRRLNTERNLPISIIMGDVNGLKLTNDIFGHSYGDILLEKVGEVLRTVCRVDDIIARWGGDEFIILLPKTSGSEADLIIERVKSEFSKEQIKAIKGSISMGASTKEDISVNIMDVLDKAEEKMYYIKTLERSEVMSSVISAILTKLYENNAGEKEHSLHVSELCQKIGRELMLQEVDIRKLKEAGYLHDIGKIVLEPKLITKFFDLSEQEKSERKKHCIVGYRILNSFDETVDLAEIVLAHHELWDGSGYPKGLKGEEIPLLARIITLAESYDRLLNKIQSDETLSKNDVLEYIRKGSGKLFDPKLVELLIIMGKSDII